MRILVVHNRYLYRGGEDTVVDAEVNLLRQRGHHVWVYSRDNTDIHHMTTVDLATSTFWSRQTVHELRKLHQQFAPDLIHAHNIFPLISPSLYSVAQQLRIPVVQTLHNFRLVCPQAMLLRDGLHCEACVGRLPWRAILHRCYRSSLPQSALTSAMITVQRLRGTWHKQVSRFIVLNQLCLDTFARGGLPANKLRIKPNFVESSGAPQWQHRRGGLFIGRLSVEKGIGVLISALKKLPGVRIDVYGKGPLQSLVEAADSLRYCGFQSADVLRQKMQEAAYLVMPSTGVESFGLVAIEAFACGTPVIATRHGGLRELIVEGQTGLLVPPNDDEALASAIAYAESHPDQMRCMGVAARKNYLDAYTPERNYERLIQIYHEAVSSAPLPLMNHLVYAENRSRRQ
jgi:glycosyltransferase involved in cell wall biosynthesis